MARKSTAFVVIDTEVFLNTDNANIDSTNDCTCIGTIGTGKMCVMGGEEPKRENKTSTMEEFRRYP